MSSDGSWVKAKCHVLDQSEIQSVFSVLQIVYPLQ
jgi:hypothetical protein